MTVISSVLLFTLCKSTCLQPIFCPALTPGELDSRDCISQTPFPLALLDLDTGWHPQATEGLVETEVRLFLPLSGWHLQHGSSASGCFLWLRPLLPAVALSGTSVPHCPYSASAWGGNCFLPGSTPGGHQPLLDPHLLSTPL